MALIEHILAEYPPDQRQLRVDFDYTDEGCVARAVLALPTCTCVAQTDHPNRNDEATIDDVIEKLAAAMKGRLPS